MGRQNRTWLRALAALDADEPGYGVTAAMLADFMDHPVEDAEASLGWLEAQGYVRQPTLPRNRWMVTASGWMEA